MTVAELHGNFDPKNSTDVSRMEDALTDSVFSALRYLPADGALRHFVDSVTGGKGVPLADYNGASVCFWPHLDSQRTPSGYVEPDVLISVGDVVISVEAKLNAGFGRYDDPVDGLGQLHQMAVQGEALRRDHRIAPDKRLFVLAVTDSADIPGLEIAKARADLKRMRIADGTVTIGWMGWWQIGKLLRRLTNLAPNEIALRDDVLAYLILRKVSSVYEPIGANDWAVMAEASSVADTRVFPAVAVFKRNLEQELSADGVIWGHPLNGAQLSWTTSLDQAGAWFPGRVSLPWWSEKWGSLSDATKFGLGMYTCFDFTDPAIEVGFVVSPGSAAIANQTWVPLADSLAAQLGVHAAEGLEIAISKNVITTPTISIDVSGVDTAWLRTNLHNLAGCLLLRKRIAPDANITLVRSSVLEIRNIVEKTPLLLSLLTLPTGSNGQRGPVLVDGNAGGGHLPEQ